MTKLKQALTAYLDPLLEKHHAGECITYEDLMSSWNASQAVASDLPGTKALHESQLIAYRKASVKALQEYSQGAELPEITNDESLEAYVERVVASVEPPNWKVNVLVRKRCVEQIIRQRAMKYYQESAEEEGRIEEDDDEEEADDEVGQDETLAEEKQTLVPAATGETTAETATTKKNKPAVKKKPNKGKQQLHARKRKAVRGGRGGGKAGINNNKGQAKMA